MLASSDSQTTGSTKGGIDRSTGRQPGTLVLLAPSPEQKEKYDLEHLTDKEVISMGDKNPSSRHSL